MTQMARNAETPPTRRGVRGGAAAASRHEAADREAARRDDDLVDEMGRGSFPSSDPPSTWAGADRSRG